LFARYEEVGNIYLMLEYASKGDVFRLLYDKAAGGGGGDGDGDSDGGDGDGDSDGGGGGNTLSDAEVCERIIGPVVSAIAHLHERDIVHRDIKPENLMTSSSSNGSMGCKLADFGFAVNTRQHRVSTRLGTMEYMAPEILHCDPDARARAREEGTHLYGKEADCWAIGGGRCSHVDSP
jgi:serine/threonine protein kinase